MTDDLSKGLIKALGELPQHTEYGRWIGVGRLANELCQAFDLRLHK